MECRVMKENLLVSHIMSSYKKELVGVAYNV